MKNQTHLFCNTDVSSVIQTLVILLSFKEWSDKSVSIGVYIIVLVDTLNPPLNTTGQATKSPLQEFVKNCFVTKSYIQITQSEFLIQGTKSLIYFPAVLS